MTTTVRDIVTRAIRFLGTNVAGTAPTAVEALHGVKAYNTMLHSWKGRGVDVGHIDQTINDEFALDPTHEDGVTALLAISLAPEYSAVVEPSVIALASEGWDALKAAYKSDETLTVDLGLRLLSGSGNRGGWYRG